MVTPLTEQAEPHTGRYSRILGTLIIAALLLTTPVAAEICWGKSCSSSPLKDSGLCAICCGNHGSCISFNNCLCDDGWAGRECEMWTRCGPTCPADCNGNGRGACVPNATYVISISSYQNSTVGQCYCGDGITGTCCDQYKQGILSPPVLNFGNVSVGAATAAQTPVTYYNPLEVNQTTMQSISIGGANSGDFALGAGTCVAATNVTGSGNCTISVSFTPTAAGPRSATLTVITTDPYRADNTQVLTATLNGTGTATVSSILVDPITPSRIFAGLDGAGIYWSTNSGGSWNVASLLPVNTRIKALAITPGDSTKLFAATYGGGVYKSTDSGASWTACANTGLSNPNVASLVIDSSGKLYAGTEDGVFSSIDNCASWTAISAGLPS